METKCNIPAFDFGFSFPDLLPGFPPLELPIFLFSITLSCPLD